MPPGASHGCDYDYDCDYDGEARTGGAAFRLTAKSAVAAAVAVLVARPLHAD